MKQAALYVIIVMMAAGLSSPAAGAVTSDFDSGVDGWLAADINPVVRLWDVVTSNDVGWGVYQGTQGGCVRIGDVWYWTHIAAPSKFLGDWAHGYGSTIAYDILINYSDYAGYPCIALMGLHHTLYYVLPEPTVGAWTHMVVPLTGANCHVDHYLGPLATKQEVMEVLASVEGFFIMTEWCTGPDDTFVDNVVLNVDPKRPRGIGIRGSSLADPLLNYSNLPYRFAVWGIVQDPTAGGFKIDDGSGAPVSVAAPGYAGIAAGDYASLTGLVEPWKHPVAVQCDPQDIVKWR